MTNMSERNLAVAQKELRLLEQSLLKDILTEKQFTDVTIACNDEKQIDAHSIILSSQSMFFRRILKVNYKRHIVIYLPTVSATEMETWLEFLYFGQTEISEQVLEQFIEVGKMFEIKNFLDIQSDPPCEPDFNRTLQQFMKMKVF